MKPEIKERWIAALESGEYAQTTGHLQIAKSDDEKFPKGHCCLGVLCELAIQDGVISSREIPSCADGRTEVEYYAVRLDDDMNEVESDDTSTSDLPVAVTRWAGFNDSNPEAFLTVAEYPEIDPENELTEDAGWYVSLAEMNDEYNFDFKQIAQVIKDNL